ncbi:hypothetical protein PR048_032215 [Dryococelus australis]|uniref:Uncharacterized protein n=1 Tax=Dryococelus australis TaxID=614101 RepID=A0ABQ9G2S3_9NEOP|nr:hypothetical protein PR048_032215 [Dryococelus australis]
MKKWWLMMYHNILDVLLPLTLEMLLLIDTSTMTNVCLRNLSENVASEMRERMVSQQMNKVEEYQQEALHQ